MAIPAERLHRLTADVYERMAKHGFLPERGIELLDGLVVSMSPKGDRHYFAVSELAHQFSDQRRERYRVGSEALSLRLGPRDIVEPDISIARAVRSFARERPRASEIALIAEVADASLAFDLGLKLRKYAAAGIPEYWIVDLVNDVVHVFSEPRGAEYQQSRRFVAGDRLAPAAYPDVVIDLRAVFTR